jgi:hypothetical protein
MLSAIKLDYQPSRVADEIGNEVFDRNLASEAGAVQAVVP